jgi:hypothetical protein
MDIEFWEHTENIQKALKSPSPPIDIQKVETMHDLQAFWG